MVPLPRDESPTTSGCNRRDHQQTSSGAGEGTQTRAPKYKDMRRALIVAATCLAMLGPGIARADVLRFSGDVRIDLYERLDHEDHSQVEQTVVDLTIELHGARGPDMQTATAFGSAAITRPDGTTTIPLEASMYPPEGSGGFVHANGIGDDGSVYCFRIWDLVDAPTARPDRVIAAFEPLDRFTDGFAGTLSTAAMTDICYALEYRFGPPRAGDFSFSTVA